MVAGRLPVGVSPRRRVAVLSKKDLAGHRYDEWLAPHGCEVVLFAEDSAATRATLAGGHGFAGVQLFAGWKHNRQVDAAVLAERPFDAVVALSECDQVRAAELRAALGAPGQDLRSATAFRDKAAMKDHARAAGVPTPAYALVRTVHDLLDAAAAYPGRVVVKPVDGSGAAGVTALAGPDAALAWAQRAGLRCDEPPRLLVEEHVAAPMLSVDGLTAGGTVLAATVGAYTRTCLDSLSELAPHGILLLDPDDPRRAAALGATRAVLAALPAPPTPTSFHCELFDHPDRGPLLCEVACRTGGGNLRRVVRRTLGIDLERAGCLGQAGLPTEPADVVDGCRYGDVVFPASGHNPRPGVGPCLLPGVVELTVRAGAAGRRAAKVSEYGVDALLVAGDHAGLLTAYEQVVRWVGTELTPA